MKFGQYELRELIAVGGMAEVYKGRVVGAEGFEKWVAIKRILPDLAEDERFVKMLLTEARIHSALSHRNIVQIHDLGISESGEYFIVLEYVEGYDLRMITDQIAAQGEIIPEALSLHIASELAQGLHFAHELRGPDDQPLGLVHRDVSPSNVLISNAGEIKLSDFGLAKRRHDRSVVGSLKGNLAYMSPEQARQSTLDRRTDVFSLGAVLFELLTGKRLREITDEIVGWNEVASGHVPSVRAVRPDLPEAFERLLARALAPEPEQRFADAASFGTAIRAVLVHMNTPVGASDLQLLLSTLGPARRPRSLVPEQSKVIRLGPEAQALGEAIAAPATPRPLVAPGFTPVAPRTPGSITGLPPPAGPARPLAEAVVTPRPAAPLSPVQPWREHARGPVPLPRTEWPTPPGARGRPGALALGGQRRGRACRLRIAALGLGRRRRRGRVPRRGPAARDGLASADRRAGAAAQVRAAPASRNGARRSARGLGVAAARHRGGGGFVDRRRGRAPVRRSARGAGRVAHARVAHDHVRAGGRRGPPRRQPDRGPHADARYDQARSLQSRAAAQRARLPPHASNGPLRRLRQAGRRREDGQRDRSDVRGAAAPRGHDARAQGLGRHRDIDRRVRQGGLETVGQDRKGDREGHEGRARQGHQSRRA